MPVRLRITLLFTLVALVILGLVGLSVYYFSSKARAATMKTRLANRAITTSRLLSQSGVFDRQLVEKIDSSTALALQDKTVQVYNDFNERIYSYSDQPGDTIPVTPELLQLARDNEHYFFNEGDREMVAYHYQGPNMRMVVLSGALDEDGRNNLLQLKNILILSFVGGSIFALIGGYFFSRRLLRPIRKITQEVTEISAQNLARRIPTGEVKDEWHDMAATLNDLLNRLQESFELQRRFISNASHELSTPLTAISSQLEIALQRERSSKEYERVMRSALQDVQQMSKLTQTLLEFAKAAGNKGGISIHLVRIDEILMSLPGILLKQNSTYEAFLDFDPLPDNPDDLLVFGNAELLQTALQNIASNACKYSPDHKATVQLKIRPEDFLIIISDKGEGIPGEDIEKIFQPFYRVDQTRHTPGFGLGLSLAYRFIKLHKGDIRVHSELGKGTTFTINVPSAKNGEF